MIFLYEIRTWYSMTYPPPPPVPPLTLMFPPSDWHLFISYLFTVLCQCIWHENTNWGHHFYLYYWRRDHVEATNVIIPSNVIQIDHKKKERRPQFKSDKNKHSGALSKTKNKILWLHLIERAPLSNRHHTVGSLGIKINKPWRSFEKYGILQMFLPFPLYFRFFLL